MAFEALCGQTHLKNILKRAWQRNHLASAYLFHGETGIGTGCAALELARLLFCETQPDDTPCGRCPGCIKFSSLDHPDLQVLFPLPSPPAGKSDDDPAIHFQTAVLKELATLSKYPWHEPEIKGARQILIAQIRHLKKWAGLRSFQGRYRVVIIFRAEAMGAQAQNALLKLLEEPPPETILLLCADRPDSLLPTIVSRCQQLRLRPVSVADLKPWLMRQPEALKLSPEELDSRISMSEGSPGKALELLRTEIPVSVADFIADAIMPNPTALAARIDALDRAKDRGALKIWINNCRSWLQDVRLLQTDPEEGAQQVRYKNELPRLLKFAEKMRVQDPEQLDRKLEKQLVLLERNVLLYSILITFAQDLRRHIVRAG